MIGVTLERLKEMIVIVHEFASLYNRFLFDQYVVIPLRCSWSGAIVWC